MFLQVEFVSVVSLTAVMGSTITTSTMSACASTLLTYQDLELAVCFMDTTQITASYQQTETGACQNISLLGVRLTSFNMTLGCKEGWEKAASNVCEQILTTKETTLVTQSGMCNTAGH